MDFRLYAPSDDLKKLFSRHPEKLAPAPIQTDGSSVLRVSGHDRSNASKILEEILTNSLLTVCESASIIG